MNTNCAGTVRSRRLLSIHWWLSNKTKNANYLRHFTNWRHGGCQQRTNYNVHCCHFFCKTNREKREFFRALHPICLMAAVNTNIINLKITVAAEKGKHFAKARAFSPSIGHLTSACNHINTVPRPLWAEKYRQPRAPCLRRTQCDTFPWEFYRSGELRSATRVAKKAAKTEGMVAQRGVPPLRARDRGLRFS